jgi:hypothetical protein
MEHTNAAVHQQTISPNGLTTIVAGPADAEIEYGKWGPAAFRNVPT